MIRIDYYTAAGDRVGRSEATTPHGAGHVIRADLRYFAGMNYSIERVAINGRKIPASQALRASDDKIAGLAR